jgi:hypothetical protein
MSVLTIEGVVENGQIRVKADIPLPEKARVYIIIPDAPALREAHVYSPRLVRAEQAADFKLEVIEADDARLQR